MVSPKWADRGRAYRRRVRLIVPAAVAVAVVMATAGGASQSKPAAAGATASTSFSPRPITYPAKGPGTAATLARGHWSRLPKAPIPGRLGAAAVWTGHAMLVWGGGAGRQGESLCGDGAAYDPSTRSWSMLPAAPLSPRTGMAAVWTGTAMFVWGGYDRVGRSDSHAVADGALYDPTTRTWHRVPPAPLSARGDATALWTGNQVVVFGGRPAMTTGMGTAYTDGATFDPVTERWHRLSSLPLVAGHEVEDSEALATARGIDVWLNWNHFTARGRHSFRATQGVDMFRYLPAARRWSRLRYGNSPPGVENALWTGREILVPAGPRFCPFSCPAPMGLRGWRLGSTDSGWISIAHGPVDDLQAQSVWTGAALLSYDTGTWQSGPDGQMFPGAAAAWDPSANRWFRLPDAPYAGESIASVWTGSALLEWGEMLPRRHRLGNSASGGSAIGLRFGGSQR